MCVLLLLLLWHDTHKLVQIAYYNVYVNACVWIFTLYSPITHTRTLSRCFILSVSIAAQFLCSYYYYYYFQFSMLTCLRTHFITQRDPFLVLIFYSIDLNIIWKHVFIHYCLAHMCYVIAAVDFCCFFLSLSMQLISNSTKWNCIYRQQASICRWMCNTNTSTSSSSIVQNLNPKTIQFNA